MYTLLIVIHIVACLILITAILLQSGKGGGLSELFSGASSQTLFGVRTPKFLTQATTAAAIIFLITCISLTMVSSRRFGSLMNRFKTNQPATQPLAVQGPAASGAPVEVEGELPVEEVAPPVTPAEEPKN